MKKIKALLMAVINLVIADIIYLSFFWDGKDFFSNVISSLILTFVIFSVYNLLFHYWELKEKYKKYIGD